MEAGQARRAARADNRQGSSTSGSIPARGTRPLPRPPPQGFCRGWLMSPQTRRARGGPDRRLSPLTPDRRGEPFGLRLDRQRSSLSCGGSQRTSGSTPAGQRRCLGPVTFLAACSGRSYAPSQWFHIYAGPSTNVPASRWGELALEPVREGGERRGRAAAGAAREQRLPGMHTRRGHRRPASARQRRQQRRWR